MQGENEEIYQNPETHYDKPELNESQKQENNQSEIYEN